MIGDAPVVAGTDLNHQIVSLRNNLVEEIDKIEEITNIYEHLRKRALESKLERLHNIEKALSIDKYVLVFIGTIGVGKTTAICHLYNLVEQFTVEDNNTKKKSQKLQELLSTGSGRTTISEVIIQPSNISYIEIEPYSIDKVATLINDFCDSFSYDDDQDGKSNEIISREIDRAIRNIIAFRRETKTIKENGRKQKKIFDRAKEAFEELGLDEFKQLAFLNADLESRTETKIYYPDSDGNEKQWIKKYFNMINQGDLKNFLIPRKIYLNLSPLILEPSLLRHVSQIVDTKGIDENPIRLDLNDYIDRDDTICIFATAFNDAPEANIRELMKYYLGSKSKYYHHRFITFVMPQKGQPEKENDGDGTWDMGVEVKREVIQSVFNTLSLDFFEGNIIFFDSLRYYHDGAILPGYEIEDIKNNRFETIHDIDSVINNRKNILLKEIDNLSSSFEEIKSGQALSDEELVKIQNAVLEIRNYSDLGQRLQSFVYDVFIDNFIEYYRNVYKAWNTKHAIHRRFGTFDVRNISLFYDGKIVAEGEDEEKMLKRFTNELKDRLENIIDGLSSAHKDLESLIPELERQLEVYYDEFIQNVGIDVENFLEDAKLAPQDISSDLWKALMDEKGKQRGRGETYTDNVCLILRRHLEDDSRNGGNLNRFLQKSAEKHWAQLVNNLLKFFG